MAASGTGKSDIGEENPARHCLVVPGREATPPRGEFAGDRAGGRRGGHGPR